MKMGDCIYKGFDVYFMFLTYVTCLGGNLCVIKECVTMFVCQKFITFLHEQNFEMILFVATRCFRVFVNSHKSWQTIWLWKNIWYNIINERNIISRIHINRSYSIVCLYQVYYKNSAFDIFIVICPTLLAFQKYVNSFSQT